MNFNDVIPGKYFKSTDFAPGEERTLTIRDAVQETFENDDGTPSKKLVVLFEEDPHGRGLVVGKQGLESLRECTGKSTTEDIVGQKLTLFVTKVPFGAKMVDGIRFRRPPIEQPKAKK